MYTGFGVCVFNALSYKIGLPVSWEVFILFIFTAILGMGITVAFCMLVYMLCLFTITPQGWRMVYCGDLAMGEVPSMMLKQVFWLVMLVLAGVLVWSRQSGRLWCREFDRMLVRPVSPILQVMGNKLK